MLWVAYKRKKSILNPALLNTVLCSNISNKCGVDIGVICSVEDYDFLCSRGFLYVKHIEANFLVPNPATLKLVAIRDYLPNDDILVDNDVLFTSKVQIDTSNCFTALNYESFRLFKQYSENEWELITNKIFPVDFTVNAGILAGPTNKLKKYASEALELSKKINCTGHTYEQMFFVRFAIDNNIPLKTVYSGEVNVFEDIEKMFKTCGVRHSFFYKSMFSDLKIVLEIAEKTLGEDSTHSFLKAYGYGTLASIARKNLFEVASGNDGGRLLDLKSR